MLRGLRGPHNIHMGPDGMLYLTDGPVNQAVKVDPSGLKFWIDGRSGAARRMWS